MVDLSQYQRPADSEMIRIMSIWLEYLKKADIEYGFSIGNYRFRIEHLDALDHTNLRLNDCHCLREMHAWNNKQ